MKTSLLILAVLSATASAFADHTPFIKPAPSRAGTQVVLTSINSNRGLDLATPPMDRGMGRYPLRSARVTTATARSSQIRQESQYRPYHRGNNRG